MAFARAPFTMLVCFSFVTGAAGTATQRMALNSRGNLQQLDGEAWWEQLPSHPIKKFSQNDEDGILEHLFKHVGTSNKYYVEFGSQSGVEVNSRRLREDFGWTGLLMDSGFERPEIGLYKEYITPQNIAGLFQKHSVPKDADLVSVDVDSFDAFVMREILSAGYRPRVLIVEANDNYGDESYLSFPPDVKVDDFSPADGPCGQTCRFADPRSGGQTQLALCGAGTRALTHIASEKGYKLVYVNRVNAFFIRNDLVPAKMQQDWTFEHVMDRAKVLGRRAGLRVLEKGGSCEKLSRNLVDVRSWGGLNKSPATPQEQSILRKEVSVLRKE